MNIIADDKDQKKSQMVLAELENIDDECDQNNIAFVKILLENELYKVPSNFSIASIIS